MKRAWDWVCCNPVCRLALVAVCCGSIGGALLHVGEAASGLWCACSAPFAWLWSFARVEGGV